MIEHILGRLVELVVVLVFFDAVFDALKHRFFGPKDDFPKPSKYATADEYVAACRVYLEAKKNYLG